MIRGSLLTKIIFRMTVLTGAMILLVMVLLALQFRSSASVLRDRGLYVLAERITDNLTFDGNGVLAFKVRPGLDQALDGSGDTSFTIHDQSGRVLLASDAKATEPLHPFRPHFEGRIAYFQHATHQNSESHYGATVLSKIDGRPVWIQVAERVREDDAFADQIVPVLLEGAGWVIAPFLTGLLLINIFTIRRSLAPVRLASERAAAIGPDTQGLRLPVDAMPSEIRPLIEAVNAALDRLDKALDVQRQFSADAAHELLTPLAVLTAHIDTMDDRGTASAIRRDVMDMSAVVTQLLEIAELESGASGPGGPVDLREVCIDVLAMLAPLAEDQGKSLVLTGAEIPVTIIGCRQMMARALRNLVENAIAHTPGGTTVEVNLEAGATLRVIDDGPGIPPEQRDLVFQRFWRGDPGHSGGAGLGLPIVSRIVESLHGTIEVGAMPRGGTVFTLRFPQAGAPCPAIESERRPAMGDGPAPQPAGQ